MSYGKSTFSLLFSNGRSLNRSSIDHHISRFSLVLFKKIFRYIYVLLSIYFLPICVKHTYVINNGHSYSKNNGQRNDNLKKFPRDNGGQVALRANKFWQPAKIRFFVLACILENSARLLFFHSRINWLLYTNKL